MFSSNRSGQMSNINPTALNGTEAKRSSGRRDEAEDAGSGEVRKWVPQTVAEPGAVCSAKATCGTEDAIGQMPR